MIIFSREGKVRRLIKYSVSAREFFMMPKLIVDAAVVQVSKPVRNSRH